MSRRCWSSATGSSASGSGASVAGCLYASCNKGSDLSCVCCIVPQRKVAAHLSCASRPRSECTSSTRLSKVTSLDLGWYRPGRFSRATPTAASFAKSCMVGSGLVALLIRLSTCQAGKTAPVRQADGTCQARCLALLLCCTAQPKTPKQQLFEHTLSFSLSSLSPFPQSPHVLSRSKAS